MHLLETFLRQFVGLSATKFQKVKAFLHDTFENNHYRCLFVAYTAVVSLVSSCLMYGIQQASTDDEDGTASVTFFETWFTAISCFSCTGLTIARVTQWRVGAQVVMMMTIEFGSLVLCSSIPSILRLRRLWGIRCPSADRPLVRRHVNVNLAIVWCCVAYWFLVQLVAFLLLVGKRGAWWSIFHVASGFNNAGFSLDPNSFANPDVANDAYVIVVFCILMPMGNTLFPVWQQLVARGWKRLMFAVAWWWPSETYTPRMVFFGLTAKEMAEAIDELLSRPYLYYTHIFSRRQTFVLLMMWLGLTTADYLMFIPEYNTNAFISTKHQWLQALFQTITVRTSGFTIMELQKVQLGHISYWIMAMYLSSYPFIITESTARHFADEDDDYYFFPSRVDPPNSGGPIRAVSSLAMVAPPSTAGGGGVTSAPYHRRHQGEQQQHNLREILRSGAAHTDDSDVLSTPGAVSRRTSVLSARSLAAQAALVEAANAQSRESFLSSSRQPFAEDAVRSVASDRSGLADTVASTSQADAASSTVFVSRGVRNALSNIKSQAGSTVAQEIGWLYLCCIIMAYAEGNDISDVGGDSSPLVRSLFEISSAYGTVGLTMSSAQEPTLSYTFVLKPFSQVLILLIMYCGKFRGLPQTIELDAVKHLLLRRESFLSRGVQFHLPSEDHGDAEVSSEADAAGTENRRGVGYERDNTPLFDSSGGGNAEDLATQSAVVDWGPTAATSDIEDTLDHVAARSSVSFSISRDDGHGD